MDDAAQLELVCTACTWHSVYEPEALGLSLPADEPVTRAMLQELLAGAGPRLVCPECGVEGLEVRPVAGDGDWQDAVVCEICRQPIPPERVEAVPGVTRCAACQADAEAGTTAEEPEYCPKCGSPLILKTSTGGGTTRYKLFCTGMPACRL